MAFADLHGRVPRGLAIARRALEAEVHATVCAGDFSNMGGAWKEGIAPLIRSGRKLLCVPGNHEPPGLMADVVATFPWVIDLDRTSLALGPFRIAGLGAAGFDRDGFDPVAALAAVTGSLDAGSPWILVSHIPPNDRSETGALLTALCEGTRPPTALICGHAHRQAGRRWRVGETDVFCVGDRGTLVEVSGA